MQALRIVKRNFCAVHLLLAPGEGDKPEENQMVGRAAGAESVDPMGLIRGPGF